MATNPFQKGSPPPKKNSMFGEFFFQKVRNDEIENLGSHYEPLLKIEKKKKNYLKKTQLSVSGHGVVNVNTFSTTVKDEISEERYIQA